MAIRIVVEIDGRDVSVVSAKRVDMEPMGTPTEDPLATPRQGIYAELRDANAEPVLRQHLVEEVPSAELLAPPGSEQRVQRIPMPGTKRTLMLVVPDEAREMVLFAVPTPAKGRLAAQSSGPEEFARFNLSKSVE